MEIAEAVGLSEGTLNTEIQKLEKSSESAELPKLRILEANHADLKLEEMCKSAEWPKNTLLEANHADLSPLACVLHARGNCGSGEVRSKRNCKGDPKT